MPEQKAKVEIYTWDMCPFCQMALSLLNDKGIKFTQHRIDGDENAREQMAQKTKGNKKSVPQIFIDGVSIGGYDDTCALNASGELDKLIGL